MFLIVSREQSNANVEKISNHKVGYFYFYKDSKLLARLIGKAFASGYLTIICTIWLFLTNSYVMLNKRLCVGLLTMESKNNIEVYKFYLFL